MSENKNPFGARSHLETKDGKVVIYRLDQLEKEGVAEVNRLPASIKILLESVLRNCDGSRVTEEDVAALAQWKPEVPGKREVPFVPARVLLQDFTGVPAVVDLAAMRSAIARLGGDPKRINPLVPVDLVIDHSVQVDYFGSPDALAANIDREYERNGERYALLRWAQKAFDNFRAVPPGTGIVHQVNLEFLARVVQTAGAGGETVAYPDSLVGTDSHTTMINGIGVLGWGVGGIEAEAVMLGQPYVMMPPEVIGVRLSGELPEGATATDLVLTVTQILRKRGVVGKFVEFFGPGLDRLSLPDRATLANMSPEYGATMGFFPVDGETLSYLRLTGREEALVDLVERYTKEQALFREASPPESGRYTDVLKLDMGTVEPSLAGPKRPQDRIPMGEMKRSFLKTLKDDYRKDKPTPEDERNVDSWHQEGGANQPQGCTAGGSARARIENGSVVIAAITSCTNTSNPSVMIAAGLLAKKAVERGLRVPPYVKTSLAPGSRVVTRYLEVAGLMRPLEALGFQVVGYGCTTCIGNSGPLPKEVAAAIKENDLVVAAVLSGNRNFEGRINRLTRANFLASPPLVIAYALAGRVDIDLTGEPVAAAAGNRPVYLRDIWPGREEVRREMEKAVSAGLFRELYEKVFEGDERWRNLSVPEGDLYQWDEESTYIKEPPFFIDLSPTPPPLADIHGARALAVLGDTVTTDHISPAGEISEESPAGRYLIEQGITPAQFNSFGSRRGNHEVMMRGTFGNVRLRNLMAPGTEGGCTVHLPSGETTSIYEAAMRYRDEGTPLVVLAGKEYGTGSSRDWAAKGTQLLGVKAVLAESFERIHRSNLVGMGVLPLQFMPGEGHEKLGLTGSEVFDIEGIEKLEPGKEITVRVRPAPAGEPAAPGGTGSRRGAAAGGSNQASPPGGSGQREFSFKMVARVDTPAEVESYRHGGILNMVLREMLARG